FSQLMVYGIAGLVAASHTNPVRERETRSLREVPFTVPASVTDKQVADAVYQTLQMPMTRPLPERAIRHTPDRHVLLDFYHINGIYRVTVLENEGKLRVEDQRKNLGLFFEDVHTGTPGEGKAPPLMLAWAYWNEAAMWSLLGFCLSGAYLWIA